MELNLDFTTIQVSKLRDIQFIEWGILKYKWFPRTIKRSVIGSVTLKFQSANHCSMRPFLFLSNIFYFEFLVCVCPAEARMGHEVPWSHKWLWTAQYGPLERSASAIYPDPSSRPLDLEPLRRDSPWHAFEGISIELRREVPPWMWTVPSHGLGKRRQWVGH